MNRLLRNEELRKTISMGMIVLLLFTMFPYVLVGQVLADDEGTPTAPVVLTQPSSVSATYGASVSFSVYASDGGDTLSYQWYFDNHVDAAAPVGSDSDTLTINDLKLEDAGDYYCVVSNSAGSDTSAPATLTITKRDTEVTLQASPSSGLTYGQSVQLTAQVDDSGATGTVTFSDGASWSDTVTLTGGSASTTYLPEAAGSYSFTAEYNGDGQFNASSDSLTGYSVSKADPGLSLSATPSTGVVYSNSTSLTATLNSDATGTITFMDGTTSLGNVSIVNGSATGSYTLGAGTHTLIAVYSGDTNYIADSNTITDYEVTQAEPTLSFNATPASPATYPVAVELTVTLNSDASGTVTFKDGAVTLGTASVSGGQASWTYANPGAGSHTLTATYNGDQNYQAATETLLFDISKGTQSITFANAGPVELVYSEDPYTNTITGTGNGEVTYSSNNDAVAQVDEETGVVTLTGAGTATITVTKAETDDYNSASAFYTIQVSPKALNVSNATPVNRYYDGTTAVSVDNGTLTGVINNDDVLLVNSGHTIPDKAIGTHTVTTHYTLSGTDASHYELVQPTVGTVTISARPLTVVNAEPQDRDYDGSRDVTILNGVLSNVDPDEEGVIAGDNVVLMNSGHTVASKNASLTRQEVTTGYTLSGSDIGNYELVQPEVDPILISRKLITISVSIKSKNYDGLKSAEYESGPTLNGILSSDHSGEISLDSVTFAEVLVPRFSTEEIGQQSILFTTLNSITQEYEETDFVLSGDDATNYALVQPTGIFSDILPGFEPIKGTHYDIDAPNAAGWNNQDIKVTADADYQLSLTRTAAGEWSDTLTLSNETGNGNVDFYLRDRSTGEISLMATESYKLDKTPPSNVQIRYDDNPFKSFLNVITFNLFFHKRVQVTISAEDAGSGLKQIDYSFDPEEGDTVSVPGSGVLTDFTVDGATNSASFWIEPEFKGRVSAKLTDVADNFIDLTDEGITVDTISPVISIAYDNNDNFEGDIYYKADRRATISITENNFYEEDVVITVQKDDVVQPSLLPTTWTHNGNVHTATIDFNSDGEYTLDIAYTDRSGNAALPFAQQHFIIDKTKPQLSVVYDNMDSQNGKYYKANRTATLTIEEKNFNVNNVVIVMTAVNGLGEAVSVPAVSDWTSDSDHVIHTATIPFLEEAAYTLDIDVVDRAGNSIDEFIAQEFTVDKTAPSNVTIQYNSNAIKSFLNAATFNLFFKERVTVTITADDATAGLGSIEYSYDRAEGETSSGQGNGVLTSFSKTGLTNSASFTIEPQFRGRVTVKVTDLAGNVSTNEYDGGESFTDEGITIDNIAPVIAVSFDNNSVRGEMFYNANRTATISITENNFYQEDVVIRVTMNDSLQSGMVPTNWVKSGNVHTATIAFTSDGAYTLDIEYTDRSGNTAQRFSQSRFVIDKTAPVLAVTYDNNNVYGEEYYNANRTASVTITEKNFNQGSANIVITAVDVLGNSVTLPTISAWSSSGDSHSVTIPFIDDAAYTLNVDFIDLAGNRIAEFTPQKFTIDKTAPELMKDNIVVTKKNDGALVKFLNFITFGNFYNEEVEVTITATDETSGVESISYYATTEDKVTRSIPLTTVANTTKQLDKQVVKFTINTGFKGYIFATAKDHSQNEVPVVQSTGLIIETGKDHQEVNKERPIAITPITSPNANGFYNSDVILNLSAEDRYSGLNQLTYQIGAANPVSVDFTNQSDITYSWKADNLLLKAADNNNNNVSVRLSYTDNSGNPMKQPETAELTLKVDVTKPIVTVSYDNNSFTNESFYSADRVATITVEELNFRAEDMEFNISKDGLPYTAINPSPVSWNHSGTTHTAQVRFSEDGDYEWTVAYTDLAGNKADYDRIDSFTIDQTLPVVTVSFDSNAAEGNYYNAERTAIITVVEHNFNAGDINYNPIATYDGNSIGSPSISSWSSNGDTHTASIRYSEDGEYGFTLLSTDMAGNTSEVFEQPTFIVDKTAPTLAIENIVHQSANQGEVMPIITFSDTNLDPDNLEVSLVGAIHGNVPAKGTMTQAGNGAQFLFDNIPVSPDTDDVYTLNVKVSDRAGNETEDAVEFSVNRFGSTYKFLDNTDSMLNKYLKEAQDVVVQEINIDPIVEYKVRYSKDGSNVDLVENKDFTVEKDESGPGWKMTTYTIAAQSFESEGNYMVLISSKDKAQNNSDNLNKEKELKFSIDRSAPVVTVTGIEDRETYNVDSQQVNLNVTDNLLLENVKVYLDDQEKMNLNAKELEESKGNLGLEIESSNSRQSIKIVALDAAGNEQITEVKNFLITTNLFVRFYQTTWLFYSSVATVTVGALGATGFFLFRKPPIPPVGM